MGRKRTNFRLCRFPGCDDFTKSNAHATCPVHGAQTFYKNSGVRCIGPECRRPAFVKGLCEPHDTQKRRGLELTPLLERNSRDEVRCQAPGCDDRRETVLYCAGHSTQVKNGQPLHVKQPSYEGVSCYGPECDRPAVDRGLCAGHVGQVRGGRQLAPLRYRYLAQLSDDDLVERKRENLAKRNADWHRRHALKISTDDGTVTLDLIRALRGSPCAACGATADIQIDHIVPLRHPVEPGIHSASNLQALCRRCNCSKGNKTMEEWLSCRGVTPGQTGAIGSRHAGASSGARRGRHRTPTRATVDR